MSLLAMQRESISLISGDNVEVVISVDFDTFHDRLGMLNSNKKTSQMSPSYASTLSALLA